MKSTYKCILSKGAEATELSTTVSATDSDVETGSLVIDEGEKKKLKRKAVMSISSTPVSSIHIFCYLYKVIFWSTDMCTTILCKRTVIDKCTPRET